MSLMYNEYIIASNNSINDNKYNAQKVAKSSTYKLKKILKPLMKMLSRKVSTRNPNKHQNAKNYQLEKSYGEESCYWSSEIDEENSANEELESRLFDEIRTCDENAAIFVYDGDECSLQSVHREQRFVPVHFARTEAGTFFWTTVTKPVVPEVIQPTFCCSAFQHCSAGDRWVQA